MEELIKELDNNIELLKERLESNNVWTRINNIIDDIQCQSKE